MRSARTLISLVAGLATLAVVSLSSGQTGQPGQPGQPVQNQRTNSVGKVMPPDAAPLSQQVLRVMNMEPRSLDSGIHPYDDEGLVMRPFEMLMWRDEFMQPVPGAAERYERSDDGLTWTFYLRPGARWSDGRPVTAHDFVYTFRRNVDPASANIYANFYYDFKNARAINQGQISDVEQLGVRALDDLTLVIETEQPTPYLLYIISFPDTFPAPRWAIEKHGRKWTEQGNIVTNSGFKMAEWVSGSHIRFIPDPMYNGPHKPFLEQVVQLFREPAAANILPYENDEVDMEAVDLAELHRIQSHPRLGKEIVRSPSYQSWYFIFRTREPPFDDVRVREAFTRIIDRESICDVILQGAGIPAYSMIPPGFDAYAGPAYEPVQGFDPERARALMAEAGYPRGRGFPTIETWLRAPNPITRRIAEAIQGMLRNHIGVDITFRSADMGSYMSALFDWQIPLGFIAWGADYLDPRNMLDMTWHSRPRGAQRQDWTHPAFDSLVDRAVGESDPTRRTEMYKEAERVLVSDYGGAFVYHPIGYGLRKPWLKGYARRPDGTVGSVMWTEVYIGER